MPAFTNIQILLTAVIVTLTGLLFFIGFQVILILRELHRATKKLNQSDSRAQHTTVSVLKQTFKTLSHKRINTNAVPEITPDTDTRISNSTHLSLLVQNQEQEEENKFSHIEALQERGRQSEGSRVFHRSGKPLA